MKIREETKLHDFSFLSALQSGFSGKEAHLAFQLDRTLTGAFLAGEVIHPSNAHVDEL